MQDLGIQVTEAIRGEIAPMGRPTDEQLELINQHRPLGRASYTADEIVSVPIVASNNLIWWDSRRWNKESLETMAETYPGKPFAVDHPYSVKDNVGFIYEAQIIESNAASEDILAGGGERINNQAVFQAEGFIQLVCYAAIEAGHPILNSIEFARVGPASTGCISDGTQICPLDNTPFGSQSRYRCAEGHYHPQVAWWYDIDEPDLIAPYAIKSGVISSFELSLVVMGNLPAAHIPKAG